jgi:ABC-type cobalamin/Fe3+-siderophores transport system ATPase subunit
MSVPDTVIFLIMRLKENIQFECGVFIRNPVEPLSGLALNYIILRSLKMRNIMLSNEILPSEKTKENVLKPNRPVDLRSEDLFNTKIKADAIKDFIKNHPNTIVENKMFVLYGEWGSGKTTIIDYLENELKSDFKTIYFEAWKFEKDGNLPLSLLEMICDKNINDSRKEALKSAYGVMKAFAKSTKFNFGLFSIDSKDLLDEIEKKEIEKEITLYEKNKQFQNEFKKIEDAILLNDKSKLIVFIDDLDRCEPENVLDLLSAIKLFFTYGTRTIYFCAIDKEAVNKAVIIRYGDVIKSNEYLEKIFDVSFNMPKNFNLDNILMYYFDDNKYNTNIRKNLSLFLKTINFTNPRHIKKILNKYLIIEYFKTYKLGSHTLIPELIQNENNRLIHIIFVLYFIILFEFYSSKFYEIEDYQTKITLYNYSHYKYVINRRASTSGAEFGLGEAKRAIEGNFVIQYPTLTFKDIGEGLQGNRNAFLPKFVTVFTPNPPEYLSIFEDRFNIDDYIKQFSNPDNDILVSFAKYIKEHSNDFMNINSDYNFWDLFEMCKTIL